MSGVRVKPIEWKQMLSTRENWEGETVCGDYRVTHMEPTVWKCSWIHGDFITHIGTMNERELAKQRCQEHLEDQIFGAMEPTGTPADWAYLAACIDAHADKFPVPGHMRLFIQPLLDLAEGKYATPGPVPAMYARPFHDPDPLCGCWNCSNYRSEV